MHSSGMRTAHLLTVSQHAMRRGGVCPGGGVYTGEVSARGVSTQGGIPACSGADTPPVDRQTPVKT